MSLNWGSGAATSFLPRHQLKLVIMPCREWSHSSALYVGSILHRIGSEPDFPNMGMLADCGTESCRIGARMSRVWTAQICGWYFSGLWSAMHSPLYILASVSHQLAPLLYKAESLGAVSTAVMIPLLLGSRLSRNLPNSNANKLIESATSESEPVF